MQLNEILSLVLTNWSVVTISMFTLYLPVLRGCKILFGSLTAILNILLLINAPLAMKFHLKCTKILHSHFLQQANICLFHWNCSRNIKKERENCVERIVSIFIMSYFKLGHSDRFYSWVALFSKHIFKIEK